MERKVPRGVGRDLVRYAQERRKGREKNGGKGKGNRVTVVGYRWLGMKEGKREVKANRDRKVVILRVVVFRGGGRVRT